MVGLFIGSLLWGDNFFFLLIPFSYNSLKLIDKHLKKYRPCTIHRSHSCIFPLLYTFQSFSVYFKSKYISGDISQKDDRNGAAVCGVVTVDSLH